MLDDLLISIPGLASWNHVEKIKFFAWHLQKHKGLEFFNGKDILQCYDELHLSRPSSIHPFLKKMTERKPKWLLKNKDGYRLEHRILSELNEKHGKPTATIQILKELEDLPEQIPVLAEQDYLKETIKCLRVEAYRAATVMSWNLSFYHFCQYLLSDSNRISTFNIAWERRFPGMHKKNILKIKEYSDFFEYLKEGQIIDIARSGKIITKDLGRILTEKLGRRNSAAHPSSIQFNQLTTESFIFDLIQNVVLVLKY